MFGCGNGREKRKKCVGMECVSGVCIGMGYVYIGRSVVVGDCWVCGFGEKDFKIRFGRWK